MDRVVRDAIGVKRGEGGVISVVFAASRFYRVVAGVGDPGRFAVSAATDSLSTKPFFTDSAARSLAWGRLTTDFESAGTIVGGTSNCSGSGSAAMLSRDSDDLSDSRSTFGSFFLARACSLTLASGDEPFSTFGW